MKENGVPNKIKLLITIVNRGQGEKHTTLYKENNVMYNMILLGSGTAQSELLDYLGLGRTEKDIILSIGDEENIKNLMKILKEDKLLNEPGNGIAFTTAISSVDSSLALDYIKCLSESKEE